MVRIALGAQRGSVLWLVEHATVRASAVIKPLPLDPIAPPPLKKRAETLRASAYVVRA